MKRSVFAWLLLFCLLFGLALPASASYEEEVDVPKLVEAGTQMFAAHEGHYDSVVCSDVGAVGMGILGWRGPRALLLLQMICAKAPELSLEILGEELYLEIVETTDYTLWNERIFTEEEASCTKALLGTEYAVEAENELADRDIRLYIYYAWKAGIRSDAAILYYCSIENHYGHGGACVFMRHIRELLGITEEDTINSLDEFHGAVEAAAAAGDTYVGSTLFYRTKIYRYIKNVLGWDTAPPCPGAGFTDMPPEGNWAHEGIDFVLSHRLFNGTSETTFSPNGVMNRAMLVTVLYRLAGKPACSGTASFTDLAAGSYYEAAVCWAAENGIVNGVSQTQFAPEKALTREQLAAILYRYEALQGQPAACDPAVLDGFADGKSASDYAAAALAWAVETGLLQGKPVNGVTKLCPKECATRAQVALILMRYLTAKT